MKYQKEFSNVFWNKDNERSIAKFQDENGGLKQYKLIEITNLTDDLTNFNEAIGNAEKEEVYAPMAMIEE